MKACLPFCFVVPVIVPVRSGFTGVAETVMFVPLAVLERPDGAFPRLPERLRRHGGEPSAGTVRLGEEEIGFSSSLSSLPFSLMYIPDRFRFRSGVPGHPDVPLGPKTDT